jgi:hypothetical protein
MFVRGRLKVRRRLHPEVPAGRFLTLIIANKHNKAVSTMNSRVRGLVLL